MHFSNILLKNINFIKTVCFAALYWHDFCGARVTSCNVNVTLSKWILDVHPRSESTYLATAVPMDYFLSVLHYLRPEAFLSIAPAHQRSV